jgi:uncharacterized protein YjbI with pentapeptide repeats
MDADVRRAVDHALAQASAALDGIEPPGSHLPYTLEELARYCEKPPARVVERDGDAFTIKVMLKSGRGQHVHLRKFKRADGVELIQIYTVCGKADEKKFAWALRANMKLIQGAVALAKQADDERFVLSICLLADNVSHFAIKAAVKECAYYGDWIEQKLSEQLVAAIRAGRCAGEVLGPVDLAGCDLSGADLSEARLSGARLAGANLSGAILRKTFLDGADVRGANFSGADLEFAVLGAADATDADFTGANLQRANLVGTKGHRSRFDRAQMYYSRPGNADFEGASFRSADLQRAIFRRANLTNADLTGATGQPNFESAKLDGVRR